MISCYHDFSLKFKSDLANLTSDFDFAMANEKTNQFNLYNKTDKILFYIEHFSHIFFIMASYSRGVWGVYFFARRSFISVSNTESRIKFSEPSLS